MDSQVLITQQWLNNNYGGYSDFPSVTEDGITGATTFKALVWALQLEIGVSTRDGIFGNDTLEKCPTLRESSNPDEESPSNLIYILPAVSIKRDPKTLITTMIDILYV